MPSNSTVGDIGELLVRANIEAGSGYRLSASKPLDVHHGDVTVEDELFRTITLQVKTATRADREGRVVCFAEYLESAIPESPRLSYVFQLIALTDRDVHIERSWLVPSKAFNDTAYRQHKSKDPGRVVLQFSCKTRGDTRWDAFEVTPLELGVRLESILAAGDQSWRGPLTY